MSGDSECRIRSSGPMPGKNPKNVGDMLAANCSRFPWRTKRPSENWLRIMKGPADVVFTTETPGCSFHVPVRSEEHTSELQSLAYIPCRLLLEKKKRYSH